MISVTVVLPLYKPGENWAGQFVQNRQRLNAFLPGVRFSYIVVHDGPVCGRAGDLFEVVQAACSDVVFYSYNQNRGKGYAWRYGVGKALAPFTVVMDFDFPYELQSIRELVEALRQGADVITGIREASYFSCLPWKRRVISKSYAFCNRLLLRLPTGDTQAGLKGFNAAGKAVFLQTKVDRFLIDTEFLLRAQKKQLKIKVLKLKLETGVAFSDFGYAVLKTEFLNFLSLLRLQRQLKTDAGLHTPQEVTFPAYKMAEVN